MSIHDLFLALNPEYIFNGMASAKMNQAILRTPDTKIPLNPEAVRAQWLERGELLGQEVINGLLGDLNAQRAVYNAAQQAEIKAKQQLLPEDRVIAWSKGFIAKLKEYGAGNADFIASLELADEIQSNVAQRRFKEFLATKQPLLPTDIDRIAKDALREATNYGISLHLIHEFCKEYNLLYVVGNVPEKLTSDDMGNQLKVDPRSLQAA